MLANRSFAEHVFPGGDVREFTVRMLQRDMRQVRDPIPRSPRSPAEVLVLEVEKESLIESTKGKGRLATKAERRAQEPLGVDPVLPNPLRNHSLVLTELSLAPCRLA